MNALRTLGGVLRTRFLGREVPIAVTFALTYRCNLRCRYCQIWKEAGEEMSTRQVTTAIDELVEAGLCRLGLTGGEPLLRADVAEIVEHARSRRLFLSMFTNGALVDGHLPTMRKLDVVLVSLDGPREAHDAMRGRGSFDAALHAIEVLSGEGIKVWTNTVVTNKNTDVVDYVLDVAVRNGAHAAFQPIFEHSYSVKGEDMLRHRASQQAYSALIDRIIARKKQGAPVLNTVQFLEYVRNPSWKQNQHACLAARAYGAVSPEGRVAPCPVLLQAAGLPDGRAVGFAEAFQRTARPAQCTGCYCIATVESDLLFALDPGAVLNTTRYLAGETWRFVTQRLHLAPRRPAPVAGQPGQHAAVMDYPECVPAECDASQTIQGSDQDEDVEQAATEQQSSNL